MDQQYRYIHLRVTTIYIYTTVQTMSTPRLAQKQINGEAEGDVITQDVSTAPGKEREREPFYGGEIANISESMDVDQEGGTLSLLHMRISD
jgi:hypothetical protein